MIPSLIPSLILLIPSLAFAELPDKFVKAIHQVEASGRTGAILGDNKRSLGPLQLSKAYHKDSGVKGSYTNCADLAYSIRVMNAYMVKYEPEAVKQGDWEILARLHNSGPNWKKKKHLTDAYVRKVKKELDKLSK